MTWTTKAACSTMAGAPRAAGLRRLATGRDARMPPLAVAVALVVSAGGGAPAARAQAEADVEVAGKLLEPLGQGLSELDWRGEYRNIDRALRNIWQENRWTDEADLYARDLAREVSAIPPWRFADRMTLVTERINDRYQFTPQQRALFQGLLLKEATGFLFRNAATMLPSSQEAFRTRSEGKPFTTEQVARWAKEGGPVMQDVRDTVQRFIGELQPALTAEQRRILQRDVSSYSRRRDMLDNKLEQWANGKWEPEHWGLQDDPVQTGTARPKPEVAPPAPAAVPEKRPPPGAERAAGALALPKRWLDHDPSTWVVFVLETEQKYRLDPGQVTTAESIHEELLGRAEAYCVSRRDLLDAVPLSERATHEAYAYVRDTFAELRDRLASLPTTAQRVAAEAGPREPTAPPSNER